MDRKTALIIAINLLAEYADLMEGEGYETESVDDVIFHLDQMKKECA